MRQVESLPLTRIFRWAGWVGVLAIAVLSLVPRSARPHTGAPSQLEHYAAYLLVGFFFALGYSQKRALLNSRKAALASGLADGSGERASKSSSCFAQNPHGSPSSLKG